MLSRKIHVFPMSNPIQDNLLPSAHDRALQHDHRLPAGDPAFVARNTGWFTDIQWATLDKLLDHTRAQVIDSSEHVYVVRLPATAQKGTP